MNLEKVVMEKNNQSVTTSRSIADVFDKRHDNVLKDIRSIITQDDFSLLNFKESNYKHRGKHYPEYILTKDGFTLLVMGYTGEKAMEYKKKYIQQFNAMEQFIKSIESLKLEFPAFTNAIKDSKECPKPYHYINEINMINRIVLGMSTKEFKESICLTDGVSSIRPYLTIDELKAIEYLQRVDIGLIIANKSYEERKELLVSCYNRLVQKLIA